MKANGNEDRLRKLAAAFQKIAQKTPDLRVDPPAVRTQSASDADARPIFRVRMVSGGEVQARMLVSERGAKLATRIGSGKASASDELPIDLRRGYRWDTETFDDAAQMAELLYQHMTRRLAAATEAEG